MRKVFRYVAVILAIELIVSLFAFIPVQAATLTLTPRCGPPNTEVTVSGSGYTASTEVTFIFDGDELDTDPATVTTTAAGAIPDGVTFVVPENISGTTHQVQALQGDTVVGTSNFLTPKISISPTSGAVGSVVTVTGSGFASSEEDIAVSFDGEVVTTTPAYPAANASGSWSATFKVPSKSAGEYDVDAYGAITDVDYVPEVTYSINASPKITISKSSGGVGTSVTVTGTAFTANETGVRVTFNGDRVGSTPSVSSSGTWTVTFTIPNNAGGSYPIGASGNTTDASDVPEVSFNVTPGVTINPASGPPGSATTVDGTGFLSGENITITYETTANNPVTVATTRSDDKGSWTANFNVPISSAGSHNIRARGTSTTNAPSVSYKIGSGILVNKTSGQAGTSVTVVGAGFAANEKNIIVTFDGTQQGSTTTADATGNWKLTFSTPSSTGGNHVISARGQTTQASAVEGAAFTVLPSVTADKATGSAGSSMTLTGVGFMPNESNIKITYDGSALGSAVTADDKGAWKSTVTIPASSAGTHTLQVAGADSGVVNVDLTFKIAATISVNPGQGAVNGSVNITGGGFAANSSLQILYDDTEIKTGRVTANEAGNFQKSITIPQSSAGSHTIRVIDSMNNSAEASFTMENVPPAIPKLISPDDGAKEGFFGNITPKFEWSKVTDDSGVTYVIQIDDNEDFTNPEIEEASMTNPEYSLKSSKPLAKGTYYWRIKAVDGAGNSSAWSQPYQLISGMISAGLFIGIMAAVVVLIVAGIIFLLRWMKSRKKQPQPQPVSPEIVIPEVVNAEYRMLETEEGNRKRALPWRLALPQAPQQQAKGSKGLSSEDQARLKSIIDFAKALPLAEPGANTSWLVEMAENGEGEADSASVYSQLVRGEIPVRYEPAWMRHPTYMDLQTLLEGQPLLQDLNSYIDSVNNTAAEAVQVLQDIYRDTSDEITWDIFTNEGWGYISGIYTDAFSWYQGKYLREPSDKDYSIKPEANSGGTNVFGLYGETGSPFPGRLIQTAEEKEAMQLRILHLKLRRAYRNNDRARSVVSMIAQLDVQRGRLINAFNQFNRINPA